MATQLFLKHQIFSWFLRCRKNHPKGDGNFKFINSSIIMQDHPMMQKESPKRGWQQWNHLVLRISIYCQDAERITQKGMATFIGQPWSSTSMCKMQKESPKRGWQPVSRRISILDFDPLMQKESPKRGWQLFLTTMGHSRAIGSCRKNHPKRDDNLLQILHYWQSELRDTERITQKGMATNQSTWKTNNYQVVTMQKASLKRGWQLPTDAEIPYRQYNRDAKRITQKGMATHKVEYVLLQFCSSDAERITPKRGWEDYKDK